MKKENILDLSGGVFWVFLYEDKERYIKRKFYKYDFTKRKAANLFKKEVKEVLKGGYSCFLSY